MSALYFRPCLRRDPVRPGGAYVLAGGWTWFDTVEVLGRRQAPRLIPAADAPRAWVDRWSAPRDAVAGLSLDRPRIMGILNVTPDSFSDGGQNEAPEIACSAGLAMQAAGADILDIGGESTRPGALAVDAETEIGRVVPVVRALRAAGTVVPLSIDTRKAAVAEPALLAGGSLINDVSGFTHDPTLAALCAGAGVPLCVMHSQGDPETMQNSPHYENVLLDVYDALEARIAHLERLGIPRSRIIADPGIGFGKTMAHNLALLQRISLFHGLGVPLLLGVSRKGFIGRIGRVPEAASRAPGSIAVALAALDQAVQIVRVHDVAETAQAFALWRAVREGKSEDV